MTIARRSTASNIAGKAETRLWARREMRSRLMMAISNQRGIAYAQACGNIVSLLRFQRFMRRDCGSCVAFLGAPDEIRVCRFACSCHDGRCLGLYRYPGHLKFCVLVRRWRLHHLGGEPIKMRGGEMASPPLSPQSERGTKDHDNAFGYQKSGGFAASCLWRHQSLRGRAALRRVKAGRSLLGARDQFGGGPRAIS